MGRTDNPCVAIPSAQEKLMLVVVPALLSRRILEGGPEGAEAVVPELDGQAFAFVGVERTGLPVRLQITRLK